MKKLFLITLIAIVFSACKEEKPITIHMIGDSTMSIKKPEVYPETGWGMALPDFFDETVTIKNYAVNGRSTKSFIDEGRWASVFDSLQSGDYVFIQFGHNDQKIKSPERYTAPFGEYTSNLKKFVTETSEKGAIPILFTSIVRRKFDENEKLIDTHGDYPIAMKKLAEELNVTLIDMQKLTHDLVEPLGNEKSKELYMWVDSCANFPEGSQHDTHLCVKGANTVAKIAADEIKKLHLNISEHTVE